MPPARPSTWLSTSRWGEKEELWIQPADSPPLYTDARIRENDALVLTAVKRPSQGRAEVAPRTLGQDGGREMELGDEVRRLAALYTPQLALSHAQSGVCESHKVAPSVESRISKYSRKGGFCAYRESRESCVGKICMPPRGVAICRVHVKSVCRWSTEVGGASRVKRRPYISQSNAITYQQQQHQHPAQNQQSFPPGNAVNGMGGVPVLGGVGAHVQNDARPRHFYRVGAFPVPAGRHSVQDVCEASRARCDGLKHADAARRTAIHIYNAVVSHPGSRRAWHAPQMSAFACHHADGGRGKVELRSIEYEITERPRHITDFVIFAQKREEGPPIEKEVSNQSAPPCAWFRALKAIPHTSMSETTLARVISIVSADTVLQVLYQITVRDVIQMTLKLTLLEQRTCAGSATNRPTS
ncbi:hypothetical protein DFH11DRAFT_1543093 [Phellopilus nigrolimitatus]|nr:hypothetical protein DFH11DRAFT_1543093 [Phellopilus nigrolimitatus]